MAILTVKILSMAEHMKAHRKDFSSRRWVHHCKILTQLPHLLWVACTTYDNFLTVHEIATQSTVLTFSDCEILQSNALELAVLTLEVTL